MRKIIIWICFIACYVFIWLFTIVGNVIGVFFLVFGWFSNIFLWIAGEIDEWIYHQKKKL